VKQKTDKENFDSRLEYLSDQMKETQNDLTKELDLLKTQTSITDDNQQNEIDALTEKFKVVDVQIKALDVKLGHKAE
jgi:uncharacterized coiled-coil protein SlyX